MKRSHLLINLVLIFACLAVSLWGGGPSPQPNVPVPVSQGGTGATTAATALANLGAGSSTSVSTLRTDCQASDALRISADLLAAKVASFAVGAMQIQGAAQVASAAGDNTFASCTFTGFTTLGNGNTGIKVKYLTGHTGFAEGDNTTFINAVAGFSDKVVSITGLVGSSTTGAWTGMSWQAGQESQWHVVIINGADIRVDLNDTDSGNLLANQIKLAVTYVE